MARTLDDHGVDFIGAREATRYEVYDDGAGVPTIGKGHALTMSEILSGMYEGIKLTLDQVNALFRRDLQPRVDGVNKLLGDVQVSQHAFDALVSFVYNEGVGALATSDLLKHVRDRDMAGAADEFAVWNKWRPGGKGPLVPSSGLTLRREMEKELFLMPDDDVVAFQSLLNRVMASQFDLTQDLPSLNPGQHILDEDPDTGGPL
jgi:lysozyme